MQILFQKWNPQRLSKPWLPSLILLIIMGLIFTLMGHIQPLLPNPKGFEGKQVLLIYNQISHIIALIFIAVILVWAINTPHTQKPQAIIAPKQINPKEIFKIIREYPVATALLTTCSIVMINEASPFFKEIIGWFDEMQGDYLLNNFAIRDELFKETMARNDYRFYPLAFTDLHIMSWFTPYPKIWMLANIAELIATIILGSKIVEFTLNRKNGKEAILTISILFAFTSASASNYLQFIYSERILTLAFAAFIYYLLNYSNSRDIKHRNLAIAFASIGTLYKDTAIVLFALPPLLVALSQWLDQHQSNKTRDSQDSENETIALFQMSFMFILWFGIFYMFLSGIPSAYLGAERYDAHLRFAYFEWDFRVIALALITFWRACLIRQRKIYFQLIDAANLAGLTFALCLYYLVGFRATNYMSLPVQFLAVINLYMVWENSIKPQIKAPYLHAWIAPFLAFIVVGVEHQFPGNFWRKSRDIVKTQRSWLATMKAAKEIFKSNQQNGSHTNVIISKSWFKSRSFIRSLPIDRLIFAHETNGTYQVISGTGAGKSYKPQHGDFLLDIDTGYRRLKKTGFDLEEHTLIYRYADNASNGSIYRINLSEAHRQ